MVKITTRLIATIGLVKERAFRETLRIIIHSEGRSPDRPGSGSSHSRKLRRVLGIYNPKWKPIGCHFKISGKPTERQAHRQWDWQTAKHFLSASTAEIRSNW